MRHNELLRGYLITTKPTNDNAGKCLWAFASKDGREYFVKEFLEPKRPRAESMGSAASKRILLSQCDAFERRHRSVIERIDPRDLDAGNLVTAVDFFNEGTRYYKVTDRLHPCDGVDPHALTPHQLGILLCTLVESLQLLHRLGIVHGDLKPNNVLLHQPPGSHLYTAKLIDFDDAYISGEPPEPTVIGGDALYGAPEWLRYMQEDPAVTPDQLTTAVDMFAFGLLLHTYVTGSLVGYDRSYGSPAEAVNAGAPLQLDARLDRRLAATVGALLSARSTARPAAAEVLTVLADESALRLGAVDAVPRRESGRWRFNGGGPTPVRRTPPDPVPSATPATPTAERRSRLRINLDGRTREGHK